MPSHNMYVILLSCVALILQFLPPVVTTSNLGSVTRAKGENVVFMFNTSSILEVSWGIRDGDNVNPKLITGNIFSMVPSIRVIQNADYTGRVSFVGDLSKGHAWFKITNLNTNDTNQYMAQIREQGSGDYNKISAQLTVIEPTSSLVSITREEGEDVMFMFNASRNILTVTWGIRDGGTNNLKLVLIAVDAPSVVQLGPNLNSAGYAGRVSFVGDLSKGRAWFKITNLTINDTNQYMARIYAQGGTPGLYNYNFTELIVTKRVLISSPDPLTRAVGQEVVLMVNSTAMGEATWGVRKGNTDLLDPRLIKVFNPGSAHLDSQLGSTSYAGRVSFVGNLSKGQAWFKINNLKISDTNWYLMKILLKTDPSKYRDIPIQLTVVQPATTKFIETSTREITTEASSSPTSSRPTTSQESHQLSNQSISITVVKQVYGDFSDPNSAAYKNFSDRFVSEINSVYRNVDTFRKAKVTSLSENSIPVKFVVYFKSTNEPDEICAPLKDAVKDNRLGNFKIVPGSLGCSNEPSQSFPKNQSGSACTCTSIIAACVSVIIFLILVVVVLLIYIWRLKSNTGKDAEIRISSCKQDKEFEAYENVHPMEETSVTTTTQTTRTSNAQKEFYETINENRDKGKGKAAIAANVKPIRDPSVGIEGDVDPSLPQHYQELQRMAPNPTPVYEPLNQRSFGNKGELTSKVPKTYEQLQQSASGREYQSLKSYKTDSESKV